MENSLGQVVDTVEDFDIVVPPGQNYPAEYPWDAPDPEGVYSLFLELWHGGALEAMAQASLTVTRGRILDLEVPTGLRARERARFVVHFANWQGEPFAGQAVLSIYGASGMLLTTLEAPVELTPWSEAQTELFWDTGWMPPGPYMAAATVSDLGQSVTYGVIQRGFDLHHVMFLPLILRSSTL